MKTIFKIQALSFFIILLITSCSKDDLPILEIKDYTTKIDENPSFDQFIGTIPSRINSKRELYYTFTILSQSVENALSIRNGGYYSTESGSLYVNDETVFDFEINPVITATIKVNAVSYKLDFSEEIYDTKIITVAVNLNDLPE